MDLKNMSFQDFHLRLNLSDQTNLVNSLIHLTENSEEDLRLNIRNMETLTFIMPIGTIKLPSEIFYQLKAQHSRTYYQLKKEEKKLLEKAKDTSAVTEALQRLKYNIELFENGNTDKMKEILEWRSIPNWISDKFINKGEAVLEYKGCSWWGITSIEFIGDNALDLVREIYNDNANLS